MIYLHTGCKYSEPWDIEFQKVLTKWGYNYTLVQLPDIEPKQGDMFIGRLNESCHHLKEGYADMVSGFSKVWPEPLAMHLYDDKIAQVEFLQNYPTPQQFVVRSKDREFSFPVVQKLAKGSASKNVKLIHKLEEVEIPSVHQEFCEGNDSDYRITIIGDYAMGCRRMNRPNDFRASGSNNCIVLDELPRDAVQVAWEICNEHNFITMAFDFLKLRGQWVIIEMSYTYPIYSITRYCNFYIHVPTNRRIEGMPHPASMILSDFLQMKYL